MNITIEQIQSFKGKYPKQLWFLFFSEMWERFCFYGMRGMLMYFMVFEMGKPQDSANLQYGATQAWVYAFTFIGGFFADRILGFKKSLLWGGIMMIAGSAILAVDPKAFFFLGIAFIIVGTGFFKPNISSMVGQLYRHDDHRRDAGFSMFYSGINIGAFLGGILMIGVGKGEILGNVIPQTIRWNVAFSLVAIVMVISLFTFVLNRKKLGPIGNAPEAVQSGRKRWLEWAVYIGALLSIPMIQIMVSNTKYTDYFMYFIGPFALVYLGYEMTRLTWKENSKLIAALTFILFSVVFWAIFEQAGGSLAIYAPEHLKKNLLGLPIDPNMVNNSANALFVIFFAPVAGLVWLWLHDKKLEPNGVVKFGLGFLFLGLGFYLFYTNKFFADGNAMTSLNFFAFAYLIITFGELCLSPIGLSLMTKLSTHKLQGMMMGMWFLASAYGQYVAGLFGASISPAANAARMEKLDIYSEGYKQFGIYAIVAGVLLIIIAPIIRKLMKEVR